MVSHLFWILSKGWELERFHFSCVFFLSMLSAFISLWSLFSFLSQFPPSSIDRTRCCCCGCFLASSGFSLFYLLIYFLSLICGWWWLCLLKWVYCFWVFQCEFVAGRFWWESISLWIDFLFCSISAPSPYRPLPFGEFGPGRVC